MIDHLSVAVNDMARARRFYDAVLGALGYAVVMSGEREGRTFVGYGQGQKPSFWIYGGHGKVTNGTGFHLAFVAPDHRSVDAFHAAALKHGARDEGQPGPRPHYHAHYYGAFAIDPDGHKIEAVCHKPA